MADTPATCSVRAADIDAVAGAVAAVGSDRFVPALIESVRAIVPFQSCLVLAAEPAGAPVLLNDGLGTAERAAFYGAYMGGAYLIAAGYRAGQDTDAVGVRHISEVFPGNLAASRYFTDYWGRTGMVDEAFMFFRPEGRWVIWFAFGRYAASGCYKRAELNRLRRLEPVLVAAGARHWELAPPTTRNAPAVARQHEESQAALQAFGRDALTQREYEVCQLLLHGHSSKSAARVLDISPGTERIHRRRVFAKLGVNSQVEVLARFVSMLSGSGDADASTK